ncbi:MAG: hypothetical protein J6Q94_04995 [Clostridia bacterium]|nr:hypothetical protein [Clostridia bacterium]
MKTFKKLIAIVLSVLLVSTFALPVVSFAAAEVVDNEHQTPDEFIDEKTDEDGEIIWTEISTGLFIPTFFVETVNTILSSLRAIFNQFLGFFATLIPDPDTFLPELPEEAPEDTSDLAEEVSELVVA